MDSSSDKIRSLFKHSIIYGIGLFLKKAIGFILIPLYTHQFTHFQYGKLAILYLYSGALILFFSLGLNDAFFKQFAKEKSDEKDVFSRFFFFRLFYVSIFLFLFLIFSNWIARFLLEPGDGYLIRLATLTIWIESICMPSLLILRIKNRSVKFAVVNTLRFIINCGLTILFILYFGMGVGGVLLGNLLSGLLFFFILYPQFHYYIKNKVNWSPIKELLIYGLPLLPLSFTLLGMDLADRWVIKWMAGLGKAGLYTLGYQFGAVMGILIHGFRISWISFFFNNPEKKETFANSAIILVRGSLILWGILSFFTKEIFQLMVAKEYFHAIPIVPVIAFAYMLFGLEEIFTAGFFIKSKTSLLLPIALFAFITNILLNILFIPHWGIMGASLATLISYLLFAIIAYLVAERFFPIKYDFRTILTDLGIGILLFGGSHLCGNGIIPRLIAFLILCSYIGWKERKRINSLIRQYIKH
ncbi:oligosaccharide flippase family protein [candidate division WOR-3 bacterium]|nr:oligosaccharide flippase family protein [candidate division WOR-3 bacterium]MCK4527403.1 oligosaccharide flippase family protein [candidate division WOR-3 bacterium]